MKNTNNLDIKQGMEHKKMKNDTNSLKIGGIQKFPVDQKTLSTINSIANKQRQVPDSSYIQSRLSAMSHIQNAPHKHKNFIIPVLPDIFNKFSNI
jgi:hypothetical protein